MHVSRRGFVSGLAGVIGYAGLRPDNLFAQAVQATKKAATDITSILTAAARNRVAEYDPLAKLSSNENPWGPLPSVMDAMNYAWKYSNRYGYPDGGLVEAIAQHHNVKPENILLGAGSGEILDVMALAFLDNGKKKVLGVEPTYSTVYQRASQIKAEAIKLPLNKDYSQSIPAFIEAANKHAAEVGFIYLCNPNNPTGMIVSKAEVKQLLDGIPKDMPVMIDEAYHHFVQDPNYGPSAQYVIEGRPVVIARTFSKIFGIAAMRLGYAIAPPALVAKMKPYSMASINAIVKWGAVAGLSDTAGQKKVLDQTLKNRNKAIADIKTLGYEVLPTETNFFMVAIRREVQPVIEEFHKKGVAVGRPFPPMTQHMRVSVGTEEEMARFMTAFKEILPAGRSNTAGA
jgi:histidinol-phosphate aminotransferase